MWKTNFAFSLIIVLCIASSTVSAQENPSVAQWKVRELAFIIGEWEGVDKSGKDRHFTAKWINNKSCIQVVVGNYREIVSWDLAKECLASWAFGTDGGQGKLYWKYEDGVWTEASKGTFVSRTATPMSFWVRFESIDEDTILSRSQSGPVTFTRVVNEDPEKRIEPATVPQWSVDDHRKIAIRCLGSKQYKTAELHIRKALRMNEETPSVNEVELLDMQGALAQALIEQEDYEGGLALLDEVLKRRAELFTEAHPIVEETKTAIRQACRGYAYDRCMNVDSSKEELQEALKLAKRAAELAPEKDPRIFLQAFALYRLGNMADAQKMLATAFKKDNIWTVHCMLAALLKHAAGDEQAAAKYQLLVAETAGPNANREVRKWVAMTSDVLGNRSPGMKELSDEERMAAYDLMLKEHPTNSYVLRLRGRMHGRHAQWEKARNDFHMAAEISPTVGRLIEGEAAIILYHGTDEEKNAIFKKYMAEWKDAPNHNNRMDMVLLCSLCPSADVDRNELNSLVDETLEALPSRFFLQLTKGMTLYRLGKYDDAITHIPARGKTNPKDELLALIFLAMTQKQRGNDNMAAKLLKQAQAETEEQLGDLNGPMMPYQDRPIVWCMVRTALEEAEELISQE